MAASGQNQKALEKLCHMMHERLVVLERQKLGVNPEWNPEYEEEEEDQNPVIQESRTGELIPGRVPFIRNVNYLSALGDLYLYSILESVQIPADMNMNSVELLPQDSVDAWFIRRFLNEIDTIKQDESFKKREGSFEHVVSTSMNVMSPHSDVKNFKIEVGVRYRLKASNRREYYVSSLRGEAKYYPNSGPSNRYYELWCHCFLTSLEEPYLEYKKTLHPDKVKHTWGVIVQLPSTH